MKKVFVMLCFGFAVFCHAQSNDTGIIRGRATGRPEFDLNLLFDTIEKANSATENEINEIFADFIRKYGTLQPLAGAKATIKGEELFQETEVDEKGNFSFDNLPFGKYVVTVSQPDCAGIYPNTRVTAFDQRSVVISRKNHDVTLLLEPTVALVTLQGKVYEKNKTPAVNAVVTATRVYPRSQNATRGIRTWETVTDDSGNYQFKDIPLQNFFLLSAVLLEKGTSLNNFEIHAESSMGRQGSPVVLSTITGELLFSAEKWALFRKKMGQITGKNVQMLPAAESNDSFFDIHGVKGNVITVKDIVLICDEREK